MLYRDGPTWAREARDTLRRQGRPAPGALRRFADTAAAVLGLFGGTAAALPASAADNPNHHGAAPTPASVAVTRDPFATAQLSAPAGNSFNGGTTYYPTETSPGT